MIAMGQGHHHHARGRSIAPLYWALGITLGFAAIEAVSGWFAGSLALLGDAGHMFSDATALALAAAAVWFGRRPPSARHSYGLIRAEVIAALLNGILMLGVVVTIVVEAVERLFRMKEIAVAGGVVSLVAFIGLVINVGVALILSRGEENISVRGALLHVMGDLLGSVAALIAGTVIYFTGWTPIDPILSLLICALILYSTSKLLREALHVLMEGVPPHIDLNVVGKSLARVHGVISVHDLHIWMLSSGMLALSAHVVLEDMSAWPRVLEDMRALLRRRYGIDHVTLQPEAGIRPVEAARETVIPIVPRQ